jgi:phosphate transport system permease protein
MFVCAGFSVAVTFGIVAVLLGETVEFFREVPFGEFFLGTTWAPLFEPRSFGVLPLLCGTLLIALGSGLVGIPAGLGAAIFLNEFAPKGFRSAIKPLMEILAGVPTVVYGYFAVTTITPVLRKFLPDTDVFNAASAGIVVGIMVLPMVTSLCDDALRAVPRALREAGYGLGATRFEVSTQIALPAALSGIAASFILALSRAVGETMAVALAAGATPKMTLNPFESVQTLTGYIVQVSMGDTPAGTLEYKSIFAVGMVLFVFTMVFNLLAYVLVKRFRSVYE